MLKQEFLDSLKAKLSGLPSQDVKERLDSYSEMIDDRMEEGVSEEVAVSGIGAVDEIAYQIISETSFIKLAKERIKPKRRLKAWETVLLAVGSPIWASLIIAALGVIFAVYVSLWSVIVSLWAVFASFIGCALGGVLAGGVFALVGNVATGMVILGAGIACAGLTVFSFLGCKAATKGMLVFTKKLVLGMKKCFIGKEAA